jgi:hypothetical protein
MKKIMKPRRTQRNTLRTLEEYSIRKITEKIIFKRYLYYSVVSLSKGENI